MRGRTLNGDGVEQRKGRLVLLGALLASTALIVAPEAHAQSFEELDARTGVAISNDGRFYIMNGIDAYYGSPDGVVDIGRLGDHGSQAYAISGDGQTVVGHSAGAGSVLRAFRWTASGGMQDIGALADGQAGATAYGVSGDGRRIVGNSQTSVGGTYNGFVWVEGATGGVAHNQQMYLLEVEDGLSTSANAISDNGNFAVGSYRPDHGVSNIQAMRWDLAGVESGDRLFGTGLGTLGGTLSIASAISAEGSVVVGRSSGTDGRTYAFLWREGADGGVAGNEQMYDLGTLAGGSSSNANGVSSGGDYVVGMSTDSETRTAFRWDEERGMVSVAALLAEDLVEVGNWNLSDANDISADGRVIIGTMDRGEGDRAYLARLGEGRGGLMDVEEYHQTLYAGAGGIAGAGEFLTWLPMNGSHHRPLMLTPNLSGDMCAWATGDFAHHAGSSTGLGLAEIGACTDLAGGSVRLGGAIGATSSWQDLALGGAARMQGQYVLSEVDWQPDGTPLLLSVTGMLGNYQAQIDRAYSNGAATAMSKGETDAFGGVVRVRADWLEAAVIGKTSINPYASVGFGALHVNGYAETGGPFPAVFNAQSLGHADIRLGVTAVTEFSASTKLSTTLEVAHRTGNAPTATGNVPGLFNFNLGGGTYAQTWARVGAELDHKVADNVSLSASVHLASAGRDPSLSASFGIKGGF